MEEEIEIKEHKRWCTHCAQLKPKSEYTPSRWNDNDRLCRKCDNKRQLKVTALANLRKAAEGLSKEKRESLEKEIENIYNRTPKMWLDDEDVKALALGGKE